MTQYAIPYHCYIKQCASTICDNWFVGTARSRYCTTCKRSQYQHMMANRNGNSHAPSRFTEDEVLLMRRLFLTYTAAEVATYFNCNRSLVYKYVHQSPHRYRQE